MTLERAAFAGDRLSRRSLRRFVGRPTAWFRVADDGEPVGYALTLFRARSTVARLYSLAVRPDRSGHGIGAALLADAVAAACVRGCRRLDLEVRHDNEAARRLYLRHGFAPLRVLESYYADGATGLRYALDLERLAEEPRA